MAECSDGSGAIAALHAHRPNVAFLDIRMAGSPGLEVARQACNIAHVVFTTAYEQHALEAFEVGAVRYLLKPVAVERLDRTLQRLRTRLGEAPKDIGTVLEAIRQSLRSARSADIPWITASLGDSMEASRAGGACASCCRRPSVKGRGNRVWRDAARIHPEIRRTTAACSRASTRREDGIRVAWPGTACSAGWGPHRSMLVGTHMVSVAS